MARVAVVVTGTAISSTTFGNALITDYLSQTDLTAQTIASSVTGGAGTILSFPILKADTISEKTGAAGIAVSHNMTGAASKVLSFPTVSAGTAVVTALVSAGTGTITTLTSTTGNITNVASTAVTATTVSAATSVITGIVSAGTGTITTLTATTVKADTITEKTTSNGIAVSHDMSLAAGKYVKADVHYLNPATVPASVEGYLYYDNSTAILKFYDGATWLKLPGFATGHGSYVNGATVAHGLGQAPAIVIPGVNAVQPYDVAWTADATNITWHHGAFGALAISWVAIK